MARSRDLDTPKRAALAVVSIATVVTLLATTDEPPLPDRIPMLVRPASLEPAADAPDTDDDTEARAQTGAPANAGERPDLELAPQDTEEKPTPPSDGTGNGAGDG